MLRLLLSTDQEWKLNVNLRDISGHSALMLASQKGFVVTVKELLACPSHCNRMGGRAIDLNIKDSDGNTAMHLAAMNGFRDIVELLKKAGADGNIMNHKGGTADQILADVETEEMLDRMSVEK